MERKVVDLHSMSDGEGEPDASKMRMKEAMDDFIDAMAKILEEANTNPETVTEAPFTQPVRRLDEVKAAKELDLVWSED